MAPSPSAERSPLLPRDGLGRSWPSQSRGLRARLLFAWVDPLLRLGARRPLQSHDLYLLDPENRAGFAGGLLQTQWERELTRRHETASLAAALVRAFGPAVLRVAPLKLLVDSLQFVAPLMIKRTIAFLADPTAPLSDGLTYVAVVFVAGVGQSFALRHYSFRCFETGMRVRSALGAVVFRKALALSAVARQRKSAGEIANLTAVDASRVGDVATHINSLWFSVFQIVLASVLLLYQIGAATVAGVAVILLMVPATKWISTAMRGLQKKLMEVKDERVKICHEVLAGVKVVKLQAWENAFSRRVMALRDNELAQLGAYIKARSRAAAVFSTIPSLVTATSFLTFVLLGHTLDVGTALTSLALFNILRFPLASLPQLLNSVVEAGVSVERLRGFLMEEERVPVGTGDLQATGVHVDKADFTWNDKDVAFALRDVSLRASSGELWAVVGHVGSGKSTLLGGLLGDARCVRGSVAVRGSIAYVSQQPFIQNATVRENITFGLKFDQRKYDQAVRVSSLQSDLAILPAGDMTEIGEKGINLSGGQRTRVAIARAVYQDADIYVLDDVLAVVDSHVGAEIFANCIKAALHDKLVVLVTHGLTFLNQCDRVVVLDTGRVVEQGSYDQVIGHNGVLTELVVSDRTPIDPTNRENELRFSTAGSADTPPVSTSVVTKPEALGKKVVASGRLLVDEDRSTGDVAWPVFQWWIDAAGGLRAAMVVVAAFAAVQCVDVASTLWLSQWSEDAAPRTQSQLFYLAIFVVLNTAYTLSMYVRSITTLSRGLEASGSLFGVLLTRVLGAPLSFFDTTPLGRILNRLSKDMYTVDETIPSTWVQLFTMMTSVVGTLVTISIVTPVFMVVLVPVAVGFYVSQRYFIKTSRELQRLDAISRSPVMALLTETLDGLSTIHAFAVECDFERRNEELLDRSQQAFFLNVAVNAWLGLRLDFAGTLIASFAALAAVLGHQSASQAGATFAGLAGVSLSYAFGVSYALNHLVRNLSQLQTQMVSVERIKSYSELEPEANRAATVDPPVSWPSEGQIEFRSVSLRYRPGLPRVLRDLTLTIRAREKVGIVGRTGAGKSSLVVALLRLAELDAGEICIDGVDTKTIGLHVLRDKISTIPQDPVLFSGTVRSNVDPLDQFSDDQIWAAIRRAHLKTTVKTLDDRVDERGSNLSVGQRQLLCIARALLKRSRVLLMDEATASIDTATDRKIQQSLRDEFHDCTCLTIAHRLNTVLDSDRVLVMDNGSVGEFDTPEKLLAAPNGRFASLVSHWRSEGDATT